MNNSTFIACAMSGLSEQEYINIKDVIVVKAKESISDIFCELLTIDKGNFEIPHVATRKDINEIIARDTFVLIHLSTVQSSTLFELGIAYALKKDITIYCYSIDDLPFMVKELNLLRANITINVIEDINEIVL